MPPKILHTFSVHTLYNSTVLRKARQEAKDKAFGVKGVTNLLEFLMSLKHNVEFAMTFREIALEKFYCFYWSPFQLDIYKDLIKQKIPLTIDATGSIVKKIERPFGKSGHIFLYQCVLNGSSGIIPVCQILSEKHDTNTIAYWLQEWLRSGASIPSEVVTDASAALLNAVSLAFNVLKYKDYQQSCYTYLHDPLVSLPICYIRIDIAHLIKAVARWRCFEGKHFRVKDFYLRCIGMLSTVTNISDFTEIFSAVLTVSESEWDDDDTDCRYKEIFLIEKIKTVNSIAEKEKDEDSEECSLNDSQDFSSNYQNENIVQYLEQIRNDIEQKISVISLDGIHLRLNPYYLPEFVTPFVNLCTQFVVWTNVMQVCFSSKADVATSAISEAYFNELKNVILTEDFRHLRVDKFLIKHARSIEGTIKIERAAINNSLPAVESESASKQKNFESANSRNDGSTDIKHDTCIESSVSANINHEFNASDRSLTKINTVEDKLSDVDFACQQQNNVIANSMNKNSELDIDSESDHSFQLECKKSESDYLSSQENWKGLNTDVRKTSVKEVIGINKTKRGRYLNACPDVILLHNRPHRRISLDVIRNGNLLPPVKMGGSKVYVKNTCPFDSIAEICAIGYMDVQIFKDEVDKLSGSVPFFKFIANFIKCGVDKNLYIQRASIMTSIAQIKGGIMDCTGNVNQTLAVLLNTAPSVTRISVCSDCYITRTSNVPVIEVNPTPILSEGLNFLENVIEESLKETKRPCDKCKTGVLTEIKSTGLHLSLDVECIYEQSFTKVLGFPNAPSKVNLGTIPINLSIRSQSYILCGAVACIKSPIEQGIAHYVAYCRRISGEWEEHDGLLTKIKKRNGRLPNVQLSLLIYIKAE